MKKYIVKKYEATFTLTPVILKESNVFRPYEGRFDARSIYKIVSCVSTPIQIDEYSELEKAMQFRSEYASLIRTDRIDDLGIDTCGYVLECYDENGKHTGDDPLFKELPEIECTVERLPEMHFDSYDAHREWVAAQIDKVADKYAANIDEPYDETPTGRKISILYSERYNAEVLNITHTPYTVPQAEKDRINESWEKLMMAMGDDGEDE